MIYQYDDVVSAVQGVCACSKDYSFAAAVGLFQSVLGLILIVLANRFARKVSETSLW